LQIGQLPTDPEKIKALNDILAANRIYGFNQKRQPGFPELREANPPQKKLIEAWNNPAFKVFTYTGANRIGKTTIGAILAISTVLGEWPWSGVKIPFPHNEPRKVRYVGQAWESHVKAVVEPALRFWWPQLKALETRKNNQGVDYLWVSGKRGTVEIMSNVQTSDVFEGWNGDLIVYDEPPKRDVRVACARGLIDRNGRELFCMTLLKEAYIHREVIKATLANGEPDLSVFNINADIFSNVGYGLTQEGITQFSKTLTDDEKQSRLYGKPSYMTSLVFPRFDRQVHVKDRFKIPLDALIDISIDFHPSKPWAVVFIATLKNGFKYVCDEIQDRGNPKYIAEEIIRRIRERHYERIHSIEIDPLAKGGEGNEIDVYSIVAESLASRNYSLGTASKDKDVGISIVNNLLMSENEMPAMYFFKDCVKTIQQTEDLMYDPETFKAQKTNDDFTECLYRACLKNTEWYPEFQPNSSKNKSVIL
jgi:hypothetical protein